MEGYARQAEYYIQRFDQDWAEICGEVKGVTNCRTSLHEHTDNPSDSDEVYDKLGKIRDFTNQASQARYLATHDSEVILANLIMQILNQTDGEGCDDIVEHFNFWENSKDLKLEEALVGFEFYDNNPHRERAEKMLAKLNRKRRR